MTSMTSPAANANPVNRRKRFLVAGTMVCAVGAATTLSNPFDFFSFSPVLLPKFPGMVEPFQETQQSHSSPPPLLSRKRRPRTSDANIAMSHQTVLLLLRSMVLL